MGLSKADRDSREWFVYRLRCPVSKRVRYIGISTNPKSRKRQHQSPQEAGRKLDWIKWLRSQGERPIMEIVSPPLPMLMAQSWETFLTFMFDRLYPTQLVGCATFVLKTQTVTFTTIAPFSKKKTYNR